MLWKKKVVHLQRSSRKGQSLQRRCPKRARAPPGWISRARRSSRSRAYGRRPPIGGRPHIYILDDETLEKENSFGGGVTIRTTPLSGNTTFRRVRFSRGLLWSRRWRPSSVWDISGPPNPLFLPALPRTSYKMKKSQVWILALPSVESGEPTRRVWKIDVVLTISHRLYNSRRYRRRRGLRGCHDRTT